MRRWGIVPGMTLIALTWGLLPGGSDQARAESYKYTDKDGIVHFTDNPYELPEPQRTKVLRRLEEEELERKKRRMTGSEEPQVQEKLPKGPITVNPNAGTGQVAPPSEPSQPKVDPTSDSQRKQWKKKMAEARKRVKELEEKCDQLRATRNENKRKSLIFATPGARAEANKAAASLATCEEQYAEAKHRLEKELPEQARRAGVPPGWLRD